MREDSYTHDGRDWLSCTVDKRKDLYSVLCLESSLTTAAGLSSRISTMRRSVERGRTASPRMASDYEDQRNGHGEHYSEEDSDQPHTGSLRSYSLLDDGLSASERLLPSTESVDEVASYGPHFTAKRHLSCGNPHPRVNISNSSFWKNRNRLKTTHAALVVCLNIDVDPPDIVKTNPCAVLECWVDPHSLPSNKALEAIGNNLHHQFECLSPRIKFKPYLDPSYEETQKFCQSLRKVAKDDRCLFYYNGHGVPKPTPSGELWVFNRSYSQYIPVSLIEIQNWLGSPCVYIWDCSAAGNLLSNFINFAQKRDADAMAKHGGYPDGMMPFMESIQLAACLAHEQLPMNPDLPADLFTSCLTSPMDMALRWHVISQDLPNSITYDMVTRIPGDLKDRRTPLGELNWIFVSITDTIAWTTFSEDIFFRLFRSDSFVAVLFRNFLLAERIMKNYHCTPHTYPPLPPTNTHPMWAQWDLAVDTVLRQLPDLLRNEEKTGGVVATTTTESSYTYIPTRFFMDQLTAFELWITRGGSALTKRGPGASSEAVVMEGVASLDEGEGLEHLVPRKPPEQLPIVLQNILSQPHRLRVLCLLAKFVDLGPWAVHYALTIGIFPFIVKLLQAPSRDLRPVLLFIWARILAVDPTCQTDLHGNHGYKYFANSLALPDEPPSTISNGAENRAMCCFILSAIVRGYPQAQNACWQERVFDNCFERLDDDDFLPKQWMALCIGQMWDGNDDIKIYGVDRGTQDKLIGMLSDPSPEVRSAALFALGTFMGASGSSDINKKGGGGTGSMYHLDERIHFRLEVAVGTGATLSTKDDASPMVRKELLILISCLVKEWRGYFVSVAWLYWEEERKRLTNPYGCSSTDEDVTNQAVAEWLGRLSDDDVYREESRVLLSSFYTIYAILLELSVDPYPEVSAYAQTIVDYIMALLLKSPFFRLDSSALHSPPPTRGHRDPLDVRSRLASQFSPSPANGPQAPRNSITRSDSATSALSAQSSNIMRRTASIANSLKNLANQYAFPSSGDEANVSTAYQGQKPRADVVDLSCPPSPNLSLALYSSPYPLESSDVMSPSDAKPDYGLHSSCDFRPSHVMEALIEEDMVRLRVRRRKRTQQRHYQQYAQASDAMTSPLGSTFSNDSSSSSASILLGLGTGVGFKDVLPLKSSFYDWCCDYFTETQMRQPEAQEPGSVQYNEQMWRQQRNEKMEKETLAQADLAKHCSWDRPIASISHSGPISRMTFHSYDPHLFVANDTNMISVYDWSRRKRLLAFNNGNPTGTSITWLGCINQDVGGMIMAASSDGIVHLYRNYDTTYEDRLLQMVTSFRALNNMLNIGRGSGLVLDWQQSQGLALAGGDSRTIRIWDAHRESSAGDFSTQLDSPVTSLATDPDSHSLFIAGFGDGSIQVFDKRLDDNDSVVRSYQEHSAWIRGMRWQKGAMKDFVSAGVDGEVKLWDLRRSRSSLVTWSLCPDGLAAFDVHEQCSVFAALSSISSGRHREQTAYVHSLHALPPNQPRLLSSFPIHSGIHHPPQRGVPSAPSSGLAFHPHEMLFGIGATDGTIRLMGCKLAGQSGPSIYRGSTHHRIAHNGGGYFATIRSATP
ncbi:KOG1 [Sanghuangporus sanghuang]